MEENNNIVEEKKEKKNNNLLVLIIAIVISLVIGIILGKLLFNNGDDTPKNNSTDNTINDNVENNNNTINDNTENSNENTEVNKLSGKINLNSYCSSNGSCQKEIGIITINNHDLTLSVDLNNINTDNVNGSISLGSNKINISDLGYITWAKSIDGFEIYQNYLILYTTSLKPEEHANCTELEGLKSYKMYIFDSNLIEVSGLTGYTLNNAYNDIKIENDYVYSYGMLNTGMALVYDKISFNDLINKQYDNSIRVSTIKECK